MTRFLVIALAMFSMKAHAGLDSVEIMTEEYPPYNFTEKGKVVGIAADLLTEVFTASGDKMHAKGPQVLPWANGYKQAQEAGKMNMLFSTTRTAARESLFKWAGPIADTKVSVFAPKGSTKKITSPEDLKKYSFAVIRDDIGHQLLKEKGVPDDKITAVDRFELIGKMMEGGRVDFFAYEQNGGFWHAKLNGMSGKFEPAFELNSGQLFFAFNKSVPDADIKKFQDAIDKVKSKLDDIRKKYQ